MKEHRLFLGAGEQRFQLLAPRHDASEIVFDFGGGHPVLDRLDDVLRISGQRKAVRLSARPRR
jgi:hypothetical protein